MSEKLCVNGHVMGSGRVTCERCNAPFVQPVVDTPMEEPEVTEAPSEEAAPEIDESLPTGNAAPAAFAPAEAGTAVDKVPVDSKATE